MFSGKEAFTALKKHFKNNSREIFKVGDILENERNLRMRKLQLGAWQTIQSVNNLALIRPVKDIVFEFEESDLANCQAITLGDNMDLLCVVMSTSFFDIISDIYFTFANNDSLPLHAAGNDNSSSRGMLCYKQICKRHSEYAAINNLQPDGSNIKFNSVLAADTFDILTSLAFSFTISHELTHALHGHRDKSYNSNSASEFFEFYKYDDSIHPDGIWNQALEMDADCSASNAALRHILTLLKDGGLPEHWSYIVNKENLVFNYWASSMHILFRTMSIWSGKPLITNPEEAKERTHPPVYVRHQFAFMTGLYNYHNELPLGTPDSFIRETISAIAKIESKWVCIFGQDEMEFLQVMMEEQTIEYTEKYIHDLREYWKNHVRSKISNHAFLELPE